MKHKLLALAAFSVAVLAQAQEPDVTIQGLPNHTTISRDDLVWTWQLHASSPRDRHDSLGDLSDWLELGPQLGGFFVPQTLTINSHALSGNITLTASDLSLGAVENTALSTWTGSSNLATLGTVAAGVWHATAIADAYIASAGVWNAKANAATTLAGYGITDPIVLTSGSYNDPAWITHLAWSKIASTPTTISGYGIADAVPTSRTVNGQALSSNVTITSVSGNAGTVTTNANLTGPITSTGNATAVTAGAITNTMLAGSIPASKLVGTDITVTESQVTSLVSDLGGKAPLASPTFTGTPAVPTAAPGTNTTQAASTAFVLANAGGGAATALASATTSVDVSAATAPTTGQVLTATNGTHATWQSQAGGGDMTRSVYDPTNTGHISGAVPGYGGELLMDGYGTFAAGNINTSAGTAAGGTITTYNGGGSINTSGNGTTAGGTINTSGGTSGNGGSILTYGLGGPSGGSINTSEGGGSIDTRGTGTIVFGNSASSTTVTGTASAPRAINFPDASGTVALGVGLNTASGILKADGAGNVSAATAGTDYLAPAGNGSALTGITPSQVGAVPYQTTTSQTLMVNGAAAGILFTDGAPIGNPYFQGHNGAGTAIDTLGFDGNGNAAVNASKILVAADIGATVLAPNGSGTGLTGITMGFVLTGSSITPVADGTYTVGIGGTQNGTITVQSGIITAVQQAVP